MKRQSLFYFIFFSPFPLNDNNYNDSMNERNILSCLNSKFCVKLYTTYQDEYNVYLLMEAVLGGELFYLLKCNKQFTEKTSRFYAACVVCALEYIHSKNIIYRDLKPENLLISSNGYLKLCDFGFAKKRDNSSTLCGTPQYISPEIIQGLNQSFGVDWWALGIFIYEMVYGITPFNDGPRLKMYQKILTVPVDFPQSSPKIHNGKRRHGHNSPLKQIIIGLLKKTQDQRLGSGPFGSFDVKNHSWFKATNWDGMERQSLAAPYIPEIRNNRDVSKFEYVDPSTMHDNKMNDQLLDDPNGTIYQWCQDF